MRLKKSKNAKLSHSCLDGGDVVKYYDDYFLVLGETEVTQGEGPQVIAVGITDGAILFEDEDEECTYHGGCYGRRG